MIKKAAGGFHPREIRVFLSSTFKDMDAERNHQEYGDDGLQTASAYSAMGVLMKLKSEIAEAHRYLRKALAIRERELGSEDEATKSVRQRLAELGAAS